MTNETLNVLTNVRNRLDDLRYVLDNHMFSSLDLPEEDFIRCRAVYDSICKTVDLL